ncbi:ThuA domain-containing protein [Pirellulaceae bacterium SH467]
MLPSVVAFFLIGFQSASPLSLQLTRQVETAEGTGRYHRVAVQENWEPKKTALILCDVWDSHHCYRAVMRVNELVPRLEETVKSMRDRGVTVIHAPSDCMKSYEGHPSRQRAQKIAKADPLPEGIREWCYRIPEEEKGKYPIDQSNGGEDDTPEEHAAWVQELVRMGRNPKTPWLKQHEGLTIQSESDFVSDKGEEIWSILEAKGIENVILAGVHTNMCVLGRPFGLRRMVQAGKRTALIADLTDTMYDPSCEPYVSHFTGTDLIIDHIERYVCSTFTSDQILGGKPFRFEADTRPTVAILMAEDEYSTEKTLPPWSIQQLGKEYRLRWIFGSETEPAVVPGIEAIRDADVLLVSVRRRPLVAESLEIVREFEKTGKPMIGIRTASHAFSLRKGATPPGVASWPEFDAEVWGGSYTNHYANDLETTVDVAMDASHSILKNWESKPNGGYVSKGSLYQVSPLKSGTQPLLMGRIPDGKQEPVAWTFQRSNGGRSFYTSLGHVSDFEQSAFAELLKNAIDWSLNKN